MNAIFSAMKPNKRKTSYIRYHLPDTMKGLPAANTKVCPKGKAICDCDKVSLKLKKLPNVKSAVRPYKKYTPPQPRNKDLPPCYNIILSSSPKGGGKSYNCVELLTSYEESGFVSSEGNDVRMRIIWVSGGTSRSKQNNILNTLKCLHDKDRIDVEDDIDDKLNEIYDSLLAERDTIEEYNEYRRVYKKFIKSNIAKMTDEELQLLEWKSYIDPAEDPDAPRDFDGNILYHYRMVFLVLDDMIGGDAFSNSKRSNFFNKLSVKSRHESDKLVGINLFYITQNLKSIPAIIRRQTDIFVLLKSANREYIIDNIATEIGSHFSKEEVAEYYDQIMKIPYGSLILSIHKQEKDENRVRMGWNNIVERDKKYIL